MGHRSEGRVVRIDRVVLAAMLTMIVNAPPGVQERIRGVAMHPAQLQRWTTQRRRARQTHPGKRAR